MNKKELEKIFDSWWQLDENKDLRMPMYLKEIPKETLIKFTPEEFRIILLYITKKIESGIKFGLKEVSK